MCGIAGYISNQSSGIITSMLRKINHRGPDGEGIYHDKIHHLTLGHKRLSIIDIHDGAQPMSDINERVLITYNGEIFNHQELRMELEKLGHVFKTKGSDTEVIINAYLQWGKMFLSKLNGMFAFVLYDKSRKILLGARDRMGEKPLFYTHLKNGNFIFASELPSLLEHPEVNPDFSLKEIQRYFAWGYSPGSSTIFENIYKLESGHYFIFDLESRKFNKHKYWEFHINVDGNMDNEEALTSELNGILDSATERRSQSDVPLCVFLSGGLDSSLVLAKLIQSNVHDDIEAFSIGFEDITFDESSYAKQVCEFFRCRHSLELLDLDLAKLKLSSLLKSFPEPLGDASVLPTYLLSEFAAKKYKVVLSGDGADELFGGYDPLIAMKYVSFYKALVPSKIHQSLRSAIELLPTSMSYMSMDFKLKRTLMGLSYSTNSMLPIWMSTLEPSEITDLFNEQVRIDDLYSEAINHWDSRTSLTPLERALEFFTRYYLPDNILVKSDRTSMLNSLESRALFLDNEVVDFAQRLPLKYKINRTTRKYLLKKVAEKFLPKNIVFRQKKGFGVPFGKWAKNDIEFKANAISAQSSSDYFSQLLSEHRTSAKDRKLFLWAWLSLQESPLINGISTIDTQQYVN